MRVASFSTVSPGPTVTIWSRKRLGLLDLGEAHAAEGADRLAEDAVGLGRAMFGGEDEAVDVAAEANGVEPEIPLIALGGRGGAGEAVDGDVLDGRGVDVLDPAGGEIGGKRLLGRHAHDVEPQRLAAAVLDAEHRLRGVVEGEALRRGESEAELRMQEAAAAHEAFARILAEDDAVDVGEIGVLGPLAPAVAGGPLYWRALASALVMRSGVDGCEDRKSGARGLMAPLCCGLSSELCSIEVRKRTAP